MIPTKCFEVAFFTWCTSSYVAFIRVIQRWLITSNALTIVWMIMWIWWILVWIGFVCGHKLRALNTDFLMVDFAVNCIGCLI